VTETPVVISLISPATQTPTLSPIRTATPQPTLTPAPPTITPLPTISTFTPTFDVRTIVTATPAPKAKCPKGSGIEFTLTSTYQSDPFPDGLDVKVNEYLNKGGSAQNIVQKLNQAGYSEKTKFEGGYRIIDLTGDGIDDLFFMGLGHEERANIFLCENGLYKQIVLDAKYSLSNKLVNIVDLNMNGMPEIIVNLTLCGSVCGSTIDIFEWNGKDFQKNGEFSFGDLDKVTIQDINHNGTKELVLIGGTPSCISCSNFIPQRLMTSVYGWNGHEFVEITNEFVPPEYRFQAIQDADTAIFVGKYEKGFRLYEEAITDKKLEWWSPERMQYKQDTYILFPGVTPLAIPTEDKNEYPKLAAYAYYRMIVLHTYLSEMDAAQVKYATLQEKFPAGNPGHPYAEMATNFWNAYQASSKMYNACASAIAYADAHPEILTVLGSDYHGWQSHIYIPADVCPFR
jgi:hypothetical protein